MERFINKILVIIFLSQSVLAQQKIVHTSQALGTTLEISKNAKFKKLEIEGKQTEIFMLLSEQQEFEYTLTITKSKDAGVTFKDFKEDEYKKSYLESCSCIIEGEQEQFYTGLKTYQFRIVTKANKQTLYGLVDNIERNGDVYAVVYLTTLDNYDKYQDAYRQVLESINFIE